MLNRIHFLEFLRDLTVTLAIWTYYIAGFLILYSPLYAAALIFSSNRETSFQGLNHLYYRSFFRIVRALIPGLEIRVQDEVRTIRSSVIVCNHLSYLDPILLISIFPRHRTIVKATFFKVPVFGWILKTAGYLSSSGQGMGRAGVAEGLESMGRFLSSGGNLFIFPEGSRSRDGRVGKFRPGAFRIARRFRAPVKVLRIGGTGTLMKPGRFLFNTHGRNIIDVRLVETLEPDYADEDFSIPGIAAHVRSLYVGEGGEGRGQKVSSGECPPSGSPVEEEQEGPLK